MKKLEKLIETLPLIEKDYDFKSDSWTYVKPHARIVDNMIMVSCENGDMAGEYYEGYINSKLVDWAKKHKTYWEWYDAGSIVTSIQ